MARVLTTKDAYSIINLLAAEATGQNASIQAVDPSTFVSVGETILASGVENTLNSLALVLGRTFMAVRPYQAKLRIISTLDSGLYANRMRKLSFYSRKALPTGASNTDLYTNEKMGFDNGPNVSGGSAQSTESMWVQNQPVPLELSFGGSSEWQDSTTVYEKQLQAAFRSENEFLDFVSGIMTEKGNDIETQKEAFNRMTLLNFMAGIYDMTADGDHDGAINLTAAFNTKFGTAYTSAQLRTTYLTEFLEFFVSYVKTLSRTLTNRSVKYHWTPAKTIGSTSYSLMRHTPYAKQKMLMLAPFWTDAEAIVKPQIFNTQYLDFGNFEAVDFWQNEANPAKIKVTPAIPDTTDPTEQTAGDQVALDYVLGVLYDEDALMTDFQYEDSSVTPKEARKHYHNIWWTFRKNAINDFTENGILLYMADPAPDPEEDEEDS